MLEDRFISVVFVEVKNISRLSDYECFVKNKKRKFGVIRYYNQLRKYGFFSVDGVVISNKMMADLLGKLTELNS